MTLRYFLFALVAFLLAPAVGAQAALSGVVVNEILVDPNGGKGPDFDTDGDGQSETDDEFVELYNTGSAAVDVSGWQLYQLSGDNAVLAHTFSAGTLVAAKGYLTVVGAWDPGTPPAGIVAASGGSLGLSNSGDEVFLLDPNANAYIGAYYNGAQKDVTFDSGATLAGEDNFGSDADSKSIQRAPDGSTNLAVSGPTPNAANASVAPESFSTILLGANEVPAVTTGGAGGVTAVLTGTELVVTGQFGGLESNYNTSVGSHLHRGAAGANGPVEYALDPTLDADNRVGTFEEAKNTFTVRSTFADSLRNGLVYVNVHTVGQPSGEIRGQLLAETPTASVTLAQARDIGAGFSVSLSGTVSRAMGDFSYVQDDGGALAIRQTFGDYFDAVAAGTIAAGTAVDLTGTLSEFNGLLQINNADLDAYTVGVTGAAPTPQVVTLAQLAADGEAYESRLISVVDVSFASSGGTFEAGGEYAVSQGDDTGVVRINDAEETALVGTTIPVVGQLTGVVDERSGAYRILPILATDVTAGGTAGKSGPEAGLRLAVANPLQGAATVRFELAAPGRVRLALFDALGRQVAVLADGAVGTGEQTATLDAGALAMGVYVLRLQAEGAAMTRTVTVVR